MAPFVAVVLAVQLVHAQSLRLRAVCHTQRGRISLATWTQPTGVRRKPHCNRNRGDLSFCAEGVKGISEA